MTAPSPDHPQSVSRFAALSPELQARIDGLCDDFEAACQSNAGVLIEDFLSGVIPEEREAVLRELIPLELAYRRDEKQLLFMADYQRRFPEVDAVWLRSQFAEVDAQTATNLRHARSTDEKVTASFDPPSIEQFFRNLVDSQLMTQSELQDWLKTVAPDKRPESSMSAARMLVDAERLTKFQVQMLLRGKPRGLVLEEYVVLDMLGRGGMGAVYRARHRRMDRVVAIKVLPPSAARDKQLLDRFRREVKAAARLVHPHIVSAYDAGEQHGIFYLVMEYVAGENLAHYVKGRGPLSVAQAVDFIRQAAAGLSYAHEQALIHRDIKPANLMLVTTGASQIVKVLDLGLARFGTEPAPDSNAATGITRSGMLIGTAEYMAPEQAVDVRNVDARADIYSLGCTLFFLLTGRHVYGGASFLEIVMAHQLQPVVSLNGIRRDVPIELDAIFRKMVAKQASQRFASMSEVLTALTRLQEKGLAAGPPQFVANPRDKERGADAESVEEFAAEAPTQPAKASAVSSAVTDLARPSVRAARKARDAAQVATTLRLDPRTKRKVVLGALSGGVVLLTAIFVWQSLANRPTSQRTVTQNDEPASSSTQTTSEPANDSPAAKRQREFAVQSKLPVEVTNSIGMHLRLVPPGEFQMGSDVSDIEMWKNDPTVGFWKDAIASEVPRHQVQLTRPFWMGETEVTVGQFRQCCDATNYKTDAERTAGFGLVNGQWTEQSGFSWKDIGEHPLTDEHPAVSISWNDATRFCEWLSSVAAERAQGRRYRLPTEAEWEFACRAGRDQFSLSEADLASEAWFAGNSGGRISPVRKLSPNNFGLYDMLGNEAEWCADRYATDYFLTSPSTDPTGPQEGGGRVQRGGNFGHPSHRCRFSARNGRYPASGQNGAFRVVMETTTRE